MDCYMKTYHYIKFNVVFNFYEILYKLEQINISINKWNSIKTLVYILYKN